MGGKINTANRAAKINEKTAVEQGNQNRNALVSELVERYYGLALARQVVEVRQQVVDGVGQHLKDAIALEQNGMIPTANVFTSNSRWPRRSGSFKTPGCRSKPSPVH